MRTARICLFIAMLGLWSLLPAIETTWLYNCPGNGELSMFREIESGQGIESWLGFIDNTSHQWSLYRYLEDNTCVESHVETVDSSLTILAISTIVLNDVHYLVLSTSHINDPNAEDSLSRELVYHLELRTWPQNELCSADSEVALRYMNNPNGTQPSYSLLSNYLTSWERGDQLAIEQGFSIRSDQSQGAWVNEEMITKIYRFRFDGEALYLRLQTEQVGYDQLYNVDTDTDCTVGKVHSHSEGDDFTYWYDGFFIRFFSNYSSDDLGVEEWDDERYGETDFLAAGYYPYWVHPIGSPNPDANRGLTLSEYAYYAPGCDSLSFTSYTPDFSSIRWRYAEPINDSSTLQMIGSVIAQDSGTVGLLVFLRTDTGTQYVIFDPVSGNLLANSTLSQPLEFVTSGYHGDILATGHGTSGWDVYRMEDWTTGVDEPSLSEPVFELHQSYPNPCNPETSIVFSLHHNSSAELAVYNCRGQLVKRLTQGNLSAGVHTVRWDGHDEQGHSVASGIYFYRLTASGQMSTRKMLLLR